VNNVVGSGVGMQSAVESSRGNRIDNINDGIESAFREWSCAEYCHTGGKLHFGDLERQLFAQIVEAGEVFVRVHLRSFGGSRVPLSLEVIEAERIADDFQTNPSTGAAVRMGIEVDEFQRPVAYWIRERHLSEFMATQQSRDRLVRVPADEIFHLHIVDRWPQTRGEPWLHAVAKRLNDMDGYSEAEIVAARAAASYMGFIESPEAIDNETDENGDPVDSEFEPGLLRHLMPGEKFSSFAPNRPNPNMDPFMRMMLREVVAGAMTSYEAVSRDYSQSNYSSSRLALLDDRDTWRTLQAWFIRAFREPLHKLFLRQATMAGAIQSLPAVVYGANPEKYGAVQFKPRGWSWVDPTKEVEAYIAAVRAGFMTVGDVIAQTGNGRDREDVWTERRHEIDQAEELELVFDTTPGIDAQPETFGDLTPDENGKWQTKPVAEDAAKPKEDAAPAEEPARVIPMRSANA
jgi:lambda family phage portal protein